jgi:hypothetical protein
VKILRFHEGDTAADLENQRHRFRREMRLCAALSHPHIVRLIDSGEFGPGALYVVFEYVPGATLRQVLSAEGPLQQAEALHLMTQVLDALSCAHGQGVVHRDLKPENIMITRTGLRRNATVLDFGLGGFSEGAALTDAARLTRTHELMGTPSYAAPEQLRGESLSSRADLYSWGLILLECLTGEVVMSGRTPYDALMRQLGPEPVAVPAWLREQRLGRLLAAVTAKDPAARDIPEQVCCSAVVRIVRERPSAALETIVRGEETPLVGRDGELAQIVELWRRAEAGELAVVLLQGEAGIGKSRLVRELRRRVPPARCIACRCVPQGSGTPLHPVVAWLRSLSGSLDRRLDELGFDVTATWPLFADLLEVPLGEGYRPLRHSAERQRELTLAALADLVIRIATRAPLLLVLEDLHWADPTTGELLAKLIEEARAAHVAATASRPGLCLVFTARPEFTALVDG